MNRKQMFFSSTHEFIFFEMIKGCACLPLDLSVPLSTSLTQTGHNRRSILWKWAACGMCLMRLEWLLSRQAHFRWKFLIRFFSFTPECRRKKSFLWYVGKSGNIFSFTTCDHALVISKTCKPAWKSFSRENYSLIIPCSLFSEEEIETGLSRMFFLG